MNDILLDAFNAASGAEFEEIPVDIEEFVTSKDYLGLKPLSDIQYKIIRVSSQIYRLETLIAMYGEEKGRARFDETYNEIVLMLGKGSGKDHCSVIAICYIVYLLLCLKNPATYYEYNDDEPIDIINVAINSDQARTVFFARFRDRIENCPWFIGKYRPGANVIDFDKNVHAYSGHSEREAFEGKNLIAAILDEISAFALESNTGNDRADTAHATYVMYKASVTSRYPDFGKVVLLSWPRFHGDYISQRYGGFDDPDKGVIGAIGRNGADKETIIRTHTFKLNEDLPDGIEENEFTIEWEEDHITRTSLPGVFALRRPSWEVNPVRKIEDYKHEFFVNKADALGRFACMPSDSTDDSFFKDKQAIEDAFIAMNGVDQDGHFHANFIPQHGKTYFVHVDLSKVHDRCAVALAHVEKWITHASDITQDLYPVVHVDAVRWWKPSKERPMDYKEVTDYILELKRRGFDIRVVSFDRWNSHDTMNFLQARGMETELLSVANQHYDDFLSVMYDRRLVGPKIVELIDELRQLRYMKTNTTQLPKIDHPRSGFKDLSDAVCGAIWNAIMYTPKPQNKIVEVVSLKSLNKRQRKETQQEQDDRNVIRAPRRMPEEISENLDNIIVSEIRLL